MFKRVEGIGSVENIEFIILKNIISIKKHVETLPVDYVEFPLVEFNFARYL
jgi:hypothetical protein